MIGENICRSTCKTKTCDKKTVRLTARQSINAPFQLQMRKLRITFPITAFLFFSNGDKFHYGLHPFKMNVSKSDYRTLDKVFKQSDNQYTRSHNCAHKRTIV
jgi:hypothetical protein